MEQIIFVWDGDYNNYINVCLKSLRRYNKKCNITFFYLNNKIPTYFTDLNINFIKLDINKWTNRRMHHKVELTKKILDELPLNSKLLLLDCDLLFQNDPFLMFKQNKNYDLYYTTCVMSLWKEIDYPINGGVVGYINNERSRKFLNQLDKH